MKLKTTSSKIWTPKDAEVLDFFVNTPEYAKNKGGKSLDSYEYIGFKAVQRTRYSRRRGSRTFFDISFICYRVLNDLSILRMQGKVNWMYHTKVDVIALDDYEKGRSRRWTSAYYACRYIKRFAQFKAKAGWTQMSREFGTDALTPLPITVTDLTPGVNHVGNFNIVYSESNARLAKFKKDHGASASTAPTSIGKISEVVANAVESTVVVPPPPKPKSTYIMRCVNNIGVESQFELGVEYFVENIEAGSPLLHVENAEGKIVPIFKERFVMVK